MTVARPGVSPTVAEASEFAGDVLDAGAPTLSMPDGVGTEGIAIERLSALRHVITELTAAAGAREFPPVAVAGAIAVGAAAGASFWRSVAGGFECHLALGSGAEGLEGRVVPADALLEPESAERTLVAALAVSPTAPPFAALRVQRDRGAAGFDAVDRVLFQTLAAAAATAFIHDARLRQADRGEDVALLAELSRELASTLDLDRVLRLTVNLAARAVTFDRGVLALYERGECDVRAVAGSDTVDALDPGLRDVAARGAWAAGTGEPFYLSDREEPASDAERIFVQIFGEDLVAGDVASGLYLPLRDEEGVIGVLVLEASHPEFADGRHQDLAGILAAQATVAIRNALLYQQVPLAAALGAVNRRRLALLELPRRRRAITAFAAVAAIAALTLVRWPLRVVGDSATFRALEAADARALVPGVVERMLVGEGAAVARGAPVALLRDMELHAARDAALADADAADRQAGLAASRGDAAAERLRRLDAASYRRDAMLADERLRLTTVRAPVEGVVLTARPEARVGTRVEAGDAVVLIGRTDTLELELEIREDELARVRADQEVRLRIDALPGRTFSGRVRSLAELPSDSGGTVHFPVRARVPNGEGLLRPGMTAHARILTAPASVLGRLLHRPARAVRLLWWRLWA